MWQSASFMLVKADKLLETPKAFQDYVKDHFLEKNVFGQQCFVAIRASNVKMYDCFGRKRSPQGTAPSHNIELSVYREGLPEGTSLSQWITKQAKRKKPLIFEFCSSWDDGHLSPMIYYD